MADAERATYNSDLPEAVEGILCISALTDMWYENMQVCIDVLARGGVLNPECPPRDRVIPVVCGNPDLSYGTSHPLPRMAIGSVWDMIRHVLRTQFGVEQPIEFLGKPCDPIYECALARLQILTGYERYKTVYMIGDNPKSDVVGANRKGWVSIMVRTGIGRTVDVDSLCAAETPQIVVPDVYAGIKEIMKREGMA
ncbi:hypothetical protein KIPB_012549 [Kipferlia bialata]|uniref:Uncharacterized protein n=1 Tax=Kipferlia bialata TaxID=797122 RepID=A0A9K3D805_9EUKA|nr:hypothetical protein KIPB_012549 [Kipferlia bialata]|eukprot:g12549.t1